MLSGMRKAVYLPVIFILCTISCQSQAASQNGREIDAALAPPKIINDTNALKAYQNRLYQGIPGIERAANGRLWALWYGGGEGEGIYNYVMLATSADNGNTWSNLKVVIDPDGAGKVRAFDPCIWHDPLGRLWVFWSQSYEWFDGRAGVWAMVTENSGDENPVWSQPRRIANGIMMNKPVVLSDGDWLLPCAIWDSNSFPELNNERFANVIVSKDNGLTFSLRGSANVPDRHYDEHMVVELKDGRLWMLVRTSYGIGQSFSSDKGKTWTKGEPSNIAHATSRFFIGRLSSGNLLLIKHGPIDQRTKRNNLTAYISKDDGRNWLGGLLLDERLSVSYPDAVQTPDGTIYAIYDYSRYKEKEILMAVFTEDDVLAKKGVSDKFRTKVIVNKAVCGSQNSGEILYNGIQLPAEWPPRNMEPNSYEPMPVPYLNSENIPAVIPIDVGRQLFVDDFLIEKTTLNKQYHLAQKYEGNPILKPETELELNINANSMACPKSGGVWWDPKIKKFRMWYEAGWLNTIAYAESEDGLKWKRPNLDIQPGTNRILDPNIIPDSWTVFPDYERKDPKQVWMMYLRSPGAKITQQAIGMVSADGIHWSKPIPNGPTGDRSTMFYNPFRKKWVFSLRSGWRGRSRHYWERDDFLKGPMWDNFDVKGPNTPVFWTGADKLDKPDPNVGDKPQLYNLDAVAYESIMLGIYEIHRGPKNAVGMQSGIPKITELALAYSRDGFHWSRPDRSTFIPSSRVDAWDRGYVQSVGGLCLVQGDKLWFYYSGVQGTPGKYHKNVKYNGMYDKGSTGLAFLRRDGFVSLDANQQEEGYLITRPLKFKGQYLFVNVDDPNGTLQVEVLDANNMKIEPFTKNNCSIVSEDKTLYQIRWGETEDLSSLAGKKVKFKFYLTNGSLYSFWVSPDKSGASYGYVAAGGIGFDSYKDTKGIESYDAFYKNKE